MSEQEQVSTMGGFNVPGFDAQGRKTDDVAEAKTPEPKEPPEGHDRDLSLSEIVAISMGLPVRTYIKALKGNVYLRMLTQAEWSAQENWRFSLLDTKDSPKNVGVNIEHWAKHVCMMLCDATGNRYYRIEEWQKAQEAIGRLAFDEISDACEALLRGIDLEQAEKN